MKYFGFMPNDFLNGEDVSLSVWMAGCPHHCEGCHNKNMWNYDDGKEADEDAVIEKVISSLSNNGFTRNLSFLGGEPLAPYNFDFVKKLSIKVKEKYPNIKIYVWTGYEAENVPNKEVFDFADVIIDGKYVESKRDVSLKLRGSSNQRILVKGVDF